MISVIAVGLSCLLNVSSPAAVTVGASNGQCSGFYIDQGSGQVVGNWSMRVSLEPSAKAAAGFHVIKTAGRAVLTQQGRGVNQAALDGQALREITQAIAQHSGDPFDQAPTTLVF